MLFVYIVCKFVQILNFEKMKNCKIQFVSKNFFFWNCIFSLFGILEKFNLILKFDNWRQILAVLKCNLVVKFLSPPPPFPLEILETVFHWRN